tara:strand:+ start:1746 stop:2591 length:846 start_codon:yes stop_codon:yes gene_type:complete
MTSILVTGAGGFIGKHLSTKLAEKKKYKIVKIDRSFGDISEEKTWKKFPICKTVIHLAGQTFVPSSWVNPSRFLNTNVISTILALDYCKKNKAKLILLSSYLYGNTRKTPIDETEAVKPTNPYAQSKKISEDICKFYFNNYSINTVILRPFNVYGSGQKEHFLIPSILQQIQSSKIISVTNLKAKRDFIYVKDLVDAIIKTIDLKKKFEIINIGSGKSYSVSEVIEAIQRIKGTNLRSKSKKETHDDEILEIRADITKAKKLLNWNPAWSFEEGIKDSYGK